uniref:Putative single domain von willebrand factor type c n=1 Tax=Xenopsylla cheopis TaxID=163159 RepID=A0A6M2E0N6_XENCH
MVPTMTSVSFIVLVTCSVALGAVYRTRPSIHEDHPEKCFYAPTNSFYSPGESFTVPNQCVQITCSATFSFYGTGCGTIGASDEFEIVPVDLSKPYPDCCPTIRRKQEFNNIDLDTNDIEI